MNPVKNTRCMNLVMALSSLHSHLVRRVDGRLSIHGISFAEYRLLTSLYQAPNRSMRRVDLAASIGLTASGVTRMLAPMMKIGLVEKMSNPRDARVSLVRLSDAGEKLYRDAATSFGECAESLLHSLTSNQLDQFLKLAESLGPDSP